MPWRFKRWRINAGVVSGKALALHRLLCHGGAMNSKSSTNQISRVTSRIVQETRVYTVLRPNQGGVVDHFSKSIDGKNNKERGSGACNAILLARIQKTAPPPHPRKTFSMPCPPPTQPGNNHELTV